MEEIASDEGELSPMSDEGDLFGSIIRALDVKLGELENRFSTATDTAVRARSWQMMLICAEERQKLLSLTENRGGYSLHPYDGRFESSKSIAEHLTSILSIKHQREPSLFKLPYARRSLAKRFRGASEVFLDCLRRHRATERAADNNLAMRLHNSASPSRRIL